MTAGLDNTQFIEYCGMRFDHDGTSNISRGKAPISFSRSRIQKITLRSGFQAERPVVQTLLGGVLFAGALFPLRHIIDWLRYGGIAFDVEFLLLSLPLS